MQSSSSSFVPCGVTYYEPSESDSVTEVRVPSVFHDVTPSSSSSLGFIPVGVAYHPLSNEDDVSTDSQSSKHSVTDSSQTTVPLRASISMRRRRPSLRAVAAKSKRSIFANLEEITENQQDPAETEQNEVPSQYVGETSQPPLNPSNVNATISGSVYKAESKSKEKYRRDLREYRKLTDRQKQLLEPSEIRKVRNIACCTSLCLQQFSTKDIREFRSSFFSKTKDDQNYYLCSSVRPDLKKYAYFLSTTEVCRRAFKSVHAIGNSRLTRLHTRLEKDGSLRGSIQGRTVSPDALNAKAWLTQFINVQAEKLPNSLYYHLPDNFTKLEIFLMYKDFSLSKNVPHLSYSYFVKVWKRDFGLVKIPKKSRMSVCSICEQWKVLRDQAKSAEQKCEQTNFCLPNV